MSALATQITGVPIFYPTVCSGVDKKTSKLRVTVLCEGNPAKTGEFPVQMASNAEMFPFDDVIMFRCIQMSYNYFTWRKLITFVDRATLNSLQPYIFIL